MTRSSVLFRAARQNVKIGALAFFTLAISGTTASAGFLEDIFGGPDPVPQAAGTNRPGKRHYPSAGAERAPRRESRVKSEVNFMPAQTAHAKVRNNSSVSKTDDNSASAGSKPVVAALCAPEATIQGATAPALLAYDKTLRNGDIMVTEGGLQVFRGLAACPHDTRDFVALSSAVMPRNKRSMLLAIEDAMKRPSGYLLTAKFDKH